MIETNGRAIASIFVLCACALFALASPPVAAENFCVTTAAQLQSALTSAQDNGENDTIRVRTGTYDAPVGGFLYQAAAGEHFDLDLSGGWHALAQFPCALHDDVPWATALDGNGTTRVMRLKLDANAGNVRVARFLFMHGNDAGFSAGGLYISSESNDGTPVTVEGNAFFENFSQVGGALEVLTSGATLAVVNNLFLLNEAGTDEPATSLANSGNEETAIVFTNNTVISNHLGQSAAENAKAVYFLADRVLVVNNNFWDNDGFDLDPGMTGNRSIYNNNYQSAILHGTTDVQDNISVAPEYGGGFLDFTPARGSALVDAGRDPPGIDPGWYLADVDLNGAQRKVGARVDIGAFENERIFVDGFDPGGFFRDVE
jgi:hypothetical protein